MQAEQLLLKGFPEKIVELNQILETPGFRSKNLADVHQNLNVPIPEPIALNHSEDSPPTKKMKRENNTDEQEQSGTKVMALPNGPVPCNQRLCDLIKIVKPYIRQLLEDSNVVRFFFIFSIFQTLVHFEFHFAFSILYLILIVTLFAVENVDFIYDSQNRGRKQLWSFYPGRYSGRGSGC